MTLMNLRTVGLGLATVTLGLVTYSWVRRDAQHSSDMAGVVQPTNLPPPDWRPARIRDQPLRLAVRSDLKGMVSDRELRSVLETAVPRWNPPTVPIMLHALRLWGADAWFPMFTKTPELIGDCRAFRRILLDDAECVRVVGKFDAFLRDTRYGVRVLTSGEPLKVSTNSEGHCDQLLKVLAECEIPGSEAVITAAGRHKTVADLVRDSLSRFSLFQELEFTSIAYARWLPPVSSWENRFGERFTFDDLVQALVATPIGKGSCQGCHVPYALASIMLAHDQYPQLISKATRFRLEVHLRAISAYLTQHQLEEGDWDKKWSGNYVDHPENMFFEFKPHFDKISATGHHLEWIALVPPELRPELGVLNSAVKRLVSDILRLSNEDLAKSKGYLPLTHAARAICLTRGYDHAFTLWQQVSIAPD